MDTNMNINSSATSGDATYILQPGEVIKPMVRDSAVPEIVAKVFGLTVTSMVKLNSYDDKNYHIMVKEEQRNPHIKEVCRLGYIFKVVNSMDSARPQIIEAQNAFMDFLRSRDIPTHKAVPDVNGSFLSKERIFATAEQTGAYGDYLVVLKTYVPGQIIQSVPYTPGLLYRNGQFLGRMSKAIQEFHHPIFEKGTTTLWCLSSVPKVKEFTFAVKDPSNRAVAEKAIDLYEKKVVPLYSQFRKGYIHGDPNEQNILVQEMEGQEGKRPEEKEHEISGILDFADVARTYLLFDLAINVAYMSIDSELVDKLEVAGHILAGYLEHCQLNEAEYKSLRVAVTARLTQSLVLGAYSFHQDPSNEYVLTTAKKGWPLLHKYLATPAAEVYAKWEQIQAAYRATSN